MLAPGGRCERNRLAVMMMKAEEVEEKENVGAGAVGAVQGSRLLPLSRPQPFSDVEDYTATAVRRHHSHNFAYSSPSFLPEILGSIKPSAANRGQSSSPSQSAPFWIYAAGHGGSVEHWKKLARKAELEMHLEQEQHKSDREKDLDSIQRLRCRISVLEAAAIDRDLVIEKQRRKISSLKSQLGGVNKRIGKELSILRNQSEQMQNKFSTVTGVSEKKSKQVGQRNERLKSLFHEAEHLRKQLKEAVAARNSALCQVRESEKLFEKLEAMEPLIGKAGIINEQDLACSCNDFAADKGHKPVDLEPRRRPKDGPMMEEGGTTNADEIYAECGRFSRKQAFKKWAIILNKIRSALLMFVSKGLILQMIMKSPDVKLQQKR